MPDSMSGSASSTSTEAASPNGHPMRGVGRGHGAHPKHSGQMHTPASMTAATHAEHASVASVPKPTAKPAAPKPQKSTAEALGATGAPKSNGAGLSVGGTGEKPTQDYGGGGIED